MEHLEEERVAHTGKTGECCLNCSVTQSCPTAWTVAPPGFSVHGVSQARMLEWVAISFSMGIFLSQASNPHLLYLLHWQVDSSPLLQA